MAQNFPNNPTIGELFTQENNRFRWDGSAWQYTGTVTQTGAFQYMKKVSARVNAGTYVAFGDYAWSMWTANNRSLVAYSTTGITRGLWGSTKFFVTNGTGGQNVFNNINPFPTYIASNYSFGTHGDMQEAWVMDNQNWVSYHVTMLVGNAYFNNIISIEQLN